MKKYIRPTSYEDIPEENKHGDCFKVAFETLMHHPNYTLVHAVVTGQGAISGIQYVHAFCIDESRDMVIDNTQQPSNREIPVGLYWYLGQIEIYKEYSEREAYEEVVRTETYGPWDEIFDNYF